MKILTPGNFIHRNCVNSRYPFSRFQRFTLEAPDVPWTRQLSNYCPPDYTSDGIHGKPWADPDIQNLNASWNAEDGLLSRKSYNGNYFFDAEGRPLNIIGRTGIRGRGVLGRWGPNHAADPLVTRWKNSDKKVLQIILIQRRDTGMWALPGGMVDPGEKYSATLKREFLEEALAKSKDGALIDKFFKQGTEIYKGYVDDHRNTDNAWMETVACNFHDETGDIVGQFGLEAGDDARNVKWVDLDKKVLVYANHEEMIREVISLRNAFDPFK